MTLVVTFFYFFGWTTWVVIECVPRGAEAARQLDPCTYATSLAGVAVGSLSVATDVLILGLPLPVVHQLNLPLKRKVMVALVFLVGVAYVSH